MLRAFSHRLRGTVRGVPLTHGQMLQRLGIWQPYRSSG